jgi:hypothetical protein
MRRSQYGVACICWLNFAVLADIKEEVMQCNKPSGLRDSEVG